MQSQIQIRTGSEVWHRRALSDAHTSALSPQKMTSTKDKQETVAVVGAGIGGLASAYLLAKQGKRVTLFESEARCGGHALTVDTKEVGPIDLGFQARRPEAHARTPRRANAASGAPGLQPDHVPPPDGLLPRAWGGH